jgi:phosphoribosylformimino-5-aminoimidazole carboxamide ribotide isomerase
MILFPAIDLKGGKCVRLLRGEMNTAVVFNDDPVTQARAFERAGFEYLHCVDLDGAVEGRAVNEAVARAICAAVRMPMQLGGGIRKRAQIERWLDAGIARVILGTVALRNPELVREAARAYPERIAVGIDARDGMVAAEGWTKTSNTSAHDLAQRFEDAGVAAIIFTDISRDGTGLGVNSEATRQVADSTSVPVIASGGVGSLADIEELASIQRLAGVVVGRALYEGKFAWTDALERARGATPI